MTNKDLANLIFPNITKTIDDYEMMYPDRNLKEGEKVTRIAPSPTGYMHLGTFFQALINYLLAKNSNGVFYVRNEDTDTAREVEGAVELIMDTLQYYDVMPDEYEFHHEINGKYGPYTQSERKEIYHTFIKYLIEIGRAYPCFCTKEELSQLRERQEKNKIRPGYYGEYAKYRNISVEEAIDKIKAGEEYVIRVVSAGFPVSWCVTASSPAIRSAIARPFSLIPSSAKKRLLRARYWLTNPSGSQSSPKPRNSTLKVVMVS